MIKIICLGILKESYLKEAVNEYAKRLKKYAKLEIIELKDEKDENASLALKKEKDAVLKKLKDKDNIVILDINGEEMSSLEFANFIDKELTNNSNITFLIGASNGLDDEIKKLSSKKISFSKLTFPH